MMSLVDIEPRPSEPARPSALVIPVAASVASIGLAVALPLFMLWAVIPAAVASICLAVLPAERIGSLRGRALWVMRMTLIAVAASLLIALLRMTS